MKKALSLLLALLLVFGCLGMVACGDKKDGNDDIGEDGKVVGDAESGMPMVTIQSHTVHMCLHSELTERQEKLLKDVYELDITYTNFGYNEYTTGFATLVLSGDAPDVGKYRPDSADFPRYIVNNLVDDINQYVDLSHSFYDQVRDLIDATTYQGGNYMMPYTLEQSQTIFYNEKIFRDAGMDTPWELYQQDKWTLDKLTEYAIELTEVGADGIPTRYGFCMSRPFGILYTVGIPCGEFDTETGAVINNTKNPAFARAVKYASDWVTKYKCTPPNMEETLGWLKTGKAAMVFCQNWYNNENIVALAKDGVLGIVPMARDAQTDGYYARGECLSFWLVKGAKNPGGAISLWNAFIKDAATQAHLDPLYEQAEANGYTELNMEQMKNNYNPEKVKLVLELCPWMGGCVWWVIQNSSTWEVELEKASAGIQAQIDNLFKPLEEDLAISPKPVDDFNAYEKDADLSKYLTGGGEVKLSLDKANAQGGDGNALKVEYNVGKTGYCTINHSYGKTWENNNGLRFWIKGNGKTQIIRIRVSCVNGGIFEYEYKLTGEEGKIATIAFDDFVATDESASEDWMLQKVTSIDFILNTHGDQVFYLDNLEAYNSKK